MTRYRNFSGRPDRRVVDTEYEDCNFSQPAPRLAGRHKGVELFPGDPTPRTFRRCNLVNCEVPPGSTLIQCNTTIVEFAVQRGGNYVNTVHGYFDGARGEYVYHPEPKEYVVDPPPALPTPPVNRN